jgi:hypothetical protein
MGGREAMVNERLESGPVGSHHEKEEPTLRREAAKAAFDRETARPIPASELKTYAEALTQYHLRPEAKFLNGGFCDPRAHRASACRRNASPRTSNA